jgi:hypothetical protein
LHGLCRFVYDRRAGGRIPAREAIGLLYVGDEQKAFGGHAWNEVVLKGCWVPVDASCGESEINATHISVKDRQISRIFGDISLRMVEVGTKK